MVEDDSSGKINGNVKDRDVEIPEHPRMTYGRLKSIPSPTFWQIENIEQNIRKYTYRPLDCY